MKKQIKKLKISSRRNFLYIILALVFFVIITSFFSLLYSKEYIRSDEVFQINGEAVSKAEFLNLMINLKGSVYSSLVQKYGQGDNEKFWTTSFNGETPEETLKQQTLENLKKIKVEQILFKKYGVVDDISYAGFLKALKNENIRRAKAVEEKEPIFGPVKYDEKVYYDYLQVSNAEKLKSKLVKTDLSSTDEEIEKYYNENKDELYKNPDQIKYEKISISYLDKNGVESSDLKTNAEETMSKVLDDIKDNRQFQDIANSYMKKSNLKIEYNEQVINGDMDRYASNIIDELNRLHAGQASEIIEEKNSLSIVRVVEDIPAGYKSLKDVKSQIISAMVDKKYNVMINELIKDAKLVIDSRVYKDINI